MLKRLVLSALILGLLILAITACGSEPEPMAADGRVRAYLTSSATPRTPRSRKHLHPRRAGSQRTKMVGGLPSPWSLMDNDGRGPYSYEPADFSFSVGEKVTFTLTAETVYHTFTIDGTSFDIDVDVGDVKDSHLHLRRAGHVQPHLHPARAERDGGCHHRPIGVHGRRTRAWWRFRRPPTTPHLVFPL